MDKRDGLCVIALAFVLALSILIVDPRGDFPLNDDWSFAQTARELALHHNWHPVGWASMPLITQSLWAAPICVLSKCTFEALRSSTLVAACVLLVCSYLLFRTASLSRFASCLAALATIFNPVSYSLSYTFMTDILFAMLIVVSTLFTVRGIQSALRYDLILATVFMIAATLCRQLGLCIPLAFLVAYAITSSEKTLKKIVKAIAPLTLSILTLLLYEQWLRKTGRAPAMYDDKSSELARAFLSPPLLVKNVASNGTKAILYLGLFCLPVLLYKIKLCRFPEESRARFYFPAAVASIVIAPIIFVLAFTNEGRLMPIGKNILIRSGIGPLTLRDEYILNLGSVPELPRNFWLIVTCASIIGAWLLIFAAADLAAVAWPRLLTRRPLPSRLGVAIFAAIAVIGYLAPLLIAGLFDRYLVVLIPLASLAILLRHPAEGLKWPRLLRPLTVAITTLFVAFSVTATHDYLAWNRARWRAISELERSSHIDARSIDGGFEYNGLRLYNPNYAESSSKSWWWVDDDKYQISFGPIAGLQVLHRYEYMAYLLPGARDIYVLRRP